MKLINSFSHYTCHGTAAITSQVWLCLLLFCQKGPAWFVLCMVRIAQYRCCEFHVFLCCRLQTCVQISADFSHMESSHLQEFAGIIFILANLSNRFRKGGILFVSDVVTPSTRTTGLNTVADTTITTVCQGSHTR